MNGSVYSSFFNYRLRNQPSRQERTEGFSVLFADGGLERFRKAVASSSLPKRIACPLFLLAAKGWQLPACCFFRLYYALVALRG